MTRAVIPFFALLSASAIADVHYKLSTEPAARSIVVSVIPDARSEELSFRLPSWVPGYYVILNHHEKVSDVKAVDASGKALEVTKAEDGRAWTVKNPSKSKVTFSYRVLGDDPGLGFFAVHVRAHTAFINGAAGFVYVEGHKDEPTTLRMTMPTPTWRIATAMDSKDGVFTARDYDEMADHPIQLGIFELRTFVVDNVPFEVVFVSPTPRPIGDIDAQTTRLKELVKPTMKMYGHVPFKRYVWLYHMEIGDFSGGLEHQASNVIATTPMDPMYLDDLNSHEFVHAWNVKQMRPKVLGPFDYTKQVRTGNLWFAEGVTDYYAKLDVYRSGLQGEEYLFDALAYQIGTLQGGRTRKEKTLEEASLAAWEGSSEGIGDLSYYNKGLIAGLIFDAAIRSATQGRKSLDDVMRYLYQRHRLPKPGFEEDGVLAAINHVAGTDLTNLYQRVIRSTEEVPYEVLEEIGLRVRLPGTKHLGLGFVVEGGTVMRVTSEASANGIRNGDRLLTLHGKPWENGAAALGLPRTGYTAEVQRAGTRVKLDLKPVLEETSGYYIERNPFEIGRAHV